MDNQDPQESRLASPDEVEELFHRIHDKVIVPNVEAIVRIQVRGRIPVVVFEPLLPRTTLRAMGYTGEPVFEMPRRVRRRMAKADQVTRRWLERDGPSRVFVIAHHGTLLLNVTSDGWSLEPNSTAGRWAN